MTKGSRDGLNPGIRGEAKARGNRVLLIRQGVPLRAPRARADPKDPPLAGHGHEQRPPPLLGEQGRNDPLPQPATQAATNRLNNAGTTIKGNANLEMLVHGIIHDREDHSQHRKKEDNSKSGRTEPGAPIQTEPGAPIRPRHAPQEERFQEYAVNGRNMAHASLDRRIANSNTLNTEKAS